MNRLITWLGLWCRAVAFISWITNNIDLIQYYKVYYLITRQLFRNNYKLIDYFLIIITFLWEIEIKQNSLRIRHRCPERGSIPRRFGKSKLGLIIVTTWKSIKSYVWIRKTIDPFKAKKKVTGVKGRIWDIFWSQKMRKSPAKFSTD